MAALNVLERDHPKGSMPTIAFAFSSHVRRAIGLATGRSSEQTASAQPSWASYRRRLAGGKRRRASRTPWNLYGAAVREITTLEGPVQ